jgi:hypothetical protein
VGGELGVGEVGVVLAHGRLDLGGGFLAQRLADAVQDLGRGGDDQAVGLVAADGLVQVLGDGLGEMGLGLVLGVGLVPLSAFSTSLALPEASKLRSVFMPLSDLVRMRALPPSATTYQVLVDLLM